MKGLNWRITTVLATIVFALYLLIPTALKFGFGITVPKSPGAEDPWVFRLLPSETLKLGLDLQGGLHLVLGIDFDEVTRGAAQKLANQVKDLAEQEKVAGISAEALANNQIQVRFENESEWRKLDQAIGRNLGVAVDFVSQGENSALLRFSDEYHERVRSEAIEQSLETLRNRIDEFGIAEPTIQRQGDEKILVQFPGVSDTARLKDIISRTAKLSFQIVRSGPEVSGVPSFEDLKKWVEEFEKETGTRPDPTQPISGYMRALNAAIEKKLPEGTEVLFRKEVNINTRETSYLPYLVDKQPMVTGEDLQDASYGFDPRTNDPMVNFDLTPTGATKFERATGENVKKHMAIVLDNNVHSSPVIRERIPGGRAKIDISPMGRSLDRAIADAKDTALVLRSGALPARLLFLEERVIGPSLGADAIRSGIRAFLSGLSLVLILLFIYYRGSGAVAFTALSLNAVFVLALMAAFEGTLTLPGLAGLTLTLGMAVDANVLIFEHIREELRLGKGVNSAIAEGFTRAWSAILDGNLTTIIAGLVLISFGYGPIRGFAVTTLIGLTCSMYTAVFVTRVVFDSVVVSRNRKHLSI